MRVHTLPETVRLRWGGVGTRLAPRLIAVGVLAAVVVSVGLIWAVTRGGYQLARSRPATASTAPVVRTDLVATQQVPGTIGYGGMATVVAPVVSSQVSLAQAQAAINAAAVKVTADRTALGDTRNVNQQQLAAAQAAVSADQAKEIADCGSAPFSPMCLSDRSATSRDQAQVGLTQAKNKQAYDQAQATLAQDTAALGSAQLELSALQPTAGTGVTTYSQLPSLGAIVSQGQALYWVDGRPIPLLYGAQSAYRVMCEGVSGPDVQQLEQDLIALGFGTSSALQADGHFTSADTAAVKAWQARLGVPQTGAIHQGEVVFMPGGVRVAALHVSAGAPIQPGQPIVDVTAATKVVSVSLNPALGYSTKKGDRVSVDLPDGRTRIPGVVSDIGTVATQQPSNQSQSANGAPPSTITVVITLSDPGAVPNLDQAPVTVDITTNSVRHVLAVPVNALLAMAGGGYGVEVVKPSGQTVLLPVHTGIFDNSRVEVSGPGLAEGMKVAVPAS